MPKTQNFRGDFAPVAFTIEPESLYHVGPSPRMLFNALKPIFVEYLGLGLSAYRDAWERFEYLLRVAAVASGFRAGSGVPHIRSIDLNDSRYVPATSEWMTDLMTDNEIVATFLGQGLFRGDFEMWKEAKVTYDSHFHNFADDAAHSNLGPNGMAWVPSGTWQPDDYGRWAE